MNPIDSIGPVDTASKTARLTLQTVAAEPPSVEELTQRFQSLMQGPHHAETVPGVDGKNAVSEVLSRGEDMLQRDHQQLEKLHQDMPLLDPTQLALRTAEVMRSSAQSNFRMQAAISIASGANKSAQALLKNQ